MADFPKTEAGWCAYYRQLDQKYHTSSASPLHHDNRCQNHGQTTADYPSPRQSQATAEPAAVQALGDESQRQTIVPNVDFTLITYVPLEELCAVCHHKFAVHFVYFTNDIGGCGDCPSDCDGFVWADGSEEFPW